ncbi:hypothetical protein B0H19DRAFT_1259365 [Mycena capillaripes]|nr:hypothetical protein B0H19DRAFT_1259365 [Mycena capillaripes]
MQAHLSFLQLENRKLGANAFDDEFLAQIMLMFLLRDTSWETLVVAHLQSVTSDDVVHRLIGEYRCLTGTDSSTDSALLANNAGPKSLSATAGSKKRCGYCRYRGHIEEDDCQTTRQPKKISNAPSVASSLASDTFSMLARSPRPYTPKSPRQRGSFHVFRATAHSPSGGDGTTLEREC